LHIFKQVDLRQVLVIIVLAFSHHPVSGCHSFDWQVAWSGWDFLEALSTLRSCNLFWGETVPLGRNLLLSDLLKLILIFIVIIEVSEAELLSHLVVANDAFL